MAGKGFFVARRGAKDTVRVFMLFDAMNQYKETLYRSLVDALGPHYDVSIAFHYYNAELFDSLVAAAEAVDIVVCYADGRNDYEAAWILPTGEADPTGKAGMGRTDSIWNELNVIGVTPGIYNDTVSITKANADIYNPEFIAAMQQALINVINTPEGQEIFSVYSHTGYAVATDADYDGARAALKVAQ